MLKEGRLSVARREGNPPEKRGRGAHSVGGQTPPPRPPSTLSRPAEPAQTCPPPPSGRRALHSTLTARDGVRGIRRGMGLWKELWREAHWGREGSRSPEPEALSRLCTGEAPGVEGRRSPGNRLRFLHFLGIGSLTSPRQRTGKLRQAANAASTSHPGLRSRPFQPRETSASTKVQSRGTATRPTAELQPQQDPAQSAHLAATAAQEYGLRSEGPT